MSPKNRTRHWLYVSGRNSKKIRDFLGRQELSEDQASQIELFMYRMLRTNTLITGVLACLGVYLSYIGFTLINLYIK